MPIVSLVKFDKFKRRIEEELSSAKHAHAETEYRIKVGEVATEFKKFRFGDQKGNADEKWQNWLSEIESDLDTIWKTVRYLSANKIYNLVTGTTATIHAFAVHYRLHAELQSPHFARDIDEFVFNNESFEEKYKTPVFEWQDSRHLHPSYPAFVKLPDAYQVGRAEFFQVKEALLAGDGNSVASSSAVYGPGGYGKSSLVQEICNDDDVRAKFSGGIYWLQFGLIDSKDESVGAVGLAEAIDRMLAGQYAKAERPSLVWDNRDSDVLTLIKILPDDPLLLVADDLWNPLQVSWLSQVAKNVSVLITTRRQSVASTAANEIPIERLTDDASYRLLTYGMTDISEKQQKRFQDLAKAFKGWPLLLILANGVFKHTRGDPKARIDKSLREYEQFFADDQIDSWDIEEAGEEELDKRRKLVGLCIEAGLRAIHPSNNPEFLKVLAVFPDDVDIPFSVAIDLWSQIDHKKISSTKGLTLLRHFNDFSFFSSFNEDARLLRLHDEILAYFRSNFSFEQLRSLHRELIASIKVHTSGNWHTLPHDHTYGWARLLYHLEKAGLADDVDNLRTDFQWLKNKLAAVGVWELQRSFLPTPGRKSARDVGRAINLSIPVLSARPESLSHQLFGRLGHESDPRLQELAQAARSDTSCWPVPVRPHLSPMGLELLRLVGHRRHVIGAAFDPSGRRILTASHDRTARLWDAQTGAPIGKPLDGHEGVLTSAAFDPTGQKIVTASHDGTARLWDAEACKPIGVLEGHLDGVIYAVFGPSGRKIVTASFDGTARLWDAETCRPISILGHLEVVKYAAFDPSGRRIVTVSLDGTARLWNAETGIPLGRPLEGHVGSVTAAVFDPSGSKVVTASDDGTAQLWNAQTGAPIGLLEGHEEAVACAVFDPSGSKVVTASNDGTARLWDAQTGIPLGKPLEGHDRTVVWAAFDPSGKKVVTASYDGTARLWDANTSAPLATLEGHEGAVVCATFDPSGRMIVTASHDGTARLWDAEASASLGQPPVRHMDSVRSVAFDPSGRRIVTTSDDHTARLWDAETGTPIGVLEGHKDWVTNAAFDPSGRRIVTASPDRTARLWDAEMGAPIGKPLTGHKWAVLQAVFNPSGRRILTAATFTTRLWDAETGAPVGILDGHGREVASAVFDSSGRKLVTASFDGTARLWDAETSMPMAILEGHEGLVTDAAFDPSGRRIVTASSDCTARLWDAETGAPIGVLEGHKDRVSTAAFDPGGRRIVTASSDCTARLWDAETGAPLGVLEGHDTGVKIAIFDPSSRRIVTVSFEGTARLWDAQTGAPVGALEGHEKAVKIVAFDSSGRKIVTASDDGTLRLWDTELGAGLAVMDFDSVPLCVSWHQKQLVVGLRAGHICFFRTDQNDEHCEFMAP